MTQSESAPSTQPMTFRPSARLQKFLGNELIADPNLAILEFVKNSYDAGAQFVTVNFSLGSDPKTLTIADDGIGMDEDSFRYNWLRPGFSQKSSAYKGDAPEVEGAEKAKELARLRNPAGEKGLGRLAAGRLGTTMVVWTRPETSSQWLRVEFDWERFDDMYRPMDEIDIPFEFRSHAPDESFERGTFIEIRGLRQPWSGRVPGRPAPGRPRTRLGRLKQDLSFLILSRADKDRDIVLELDSDLVSETTDIGIIDPDSSRLETAHYVYRFDVKAEPVPDESTVSAVASTWVQRNAAAIERTGQEAMEKFPDRILGTVADSDWPGDFSGVFLYTPPSAGRRAQNIDLASTGVLLYRDNFLVEPYGFPGNDWLGVAARKAQRQGHAAIQPSTFSGQVEITRAGNPQLGDMSNRLGLLDNEASSAFINLVQTEFRRFEGLIEDEILLGANWVGKKEQKAAAQAELAEKVAHLRLKAVAHRAGQPLQAMGFDMVMLDSIASDSSIPLELQSKLSALKDRLIHNMSRLSEVVREISRVPTLESSEFDLHDVVYDCVDKLGVLASNSAVLVQTDHLSHSLAFGSRDLVFEVVHEIIANAIEAASTSESDRRVVISLSEPESTYTELRITDSGPGFGDQTDRIHDLATIESTKGRPAEGLITALNSMTATRGALWIESSTENGSTFVVQIPTGATPAPGRPDETR